MSSLLQHAFQSRARKFNQKCFTRISKPAHLPRSCCKCRHCRINRNVQGVHRAITAEVSRATKHDQPVLTNIGSQRNAYSGRCNNRRRQTSLASNCMASKKNECSRPITKHDNINVIATSTWSTEHNTIRPYEAIPTRCLSFGPIKNILCFQ